MRVWGHQYLEMWCRRIHGVRYRGLWGMLICGQIYSIISRSWRRTSRRLQQCKQTNLGFIGSTTVTNRNRRCLMRTMKLRRCLRISYSRHMGMSRCWNTYSYRDWRIFIWKYRIFCLVSHRNTQMEHCRWWTHFLGDI